MVKTYLRAIKSNRHTNRKDKVSLFEGDVEKDRRYWKKYQEATARYFELKEFKEG